ncbi:competence protein CoiA [Membranihabitans maritimus]|uniref:competence protein CoiA n=1 Tax=Membranihabitans maritimus TaxID=2904244 RepID=UPI001F39DACF|nr:competence protein CoiA family protein [Membranihabitans maritimus]
MKFALVDGKKNEAFKGAKGVCPCCGSDLIPKCGDIRIHHWAHKNSKECDHWWEPETEWHRNWKNEFPGDWQEEVMPDPENNERHIADVYNPSKKLVIEFQNSPIAIDELKSREHFYKRIIWVVNAENFDIKILPLQLIIKEIEEVERKYLRTPFNSFFKIPTQIREMLIKRRNEILENKMVCEEQIRILMETFESEFGTLVSKHQTGTLKPVGVEPNQLKNELLKPIFLRIKKEVDVPKNYGYRWLRRRKVWSCADEHVFLDRGQYLYWLKSDWVIRKIAREDFISHYNKENCIKDSG